MEDWQMVLAIVVPILGVLIPLLIHFNNVNRDAHKEIGKNIGKVEDKVDDGFKVVNTDIKDLNRSVGQLEGSLRRDLPGQRDGFMGS